MTANAEVQVVLDRAADGGRITPQEALDLYRSAPLHALGAAADAVRRRRYAGTEHIATYIIERNINYTNVCVTACKFCAFYAAPKDTAKGWSRDLDDILRRCAETVELGGTQIMFQGGHHPDYGVEYYEKHFSAIKKAFPQLVIHSLGASEVEHMARISGVSAEEAIRRIHAAGLDSFAGAGAELLPERPRKAIAPLKESGERWLEIMEIAHNLGVESTSTMLMGTGETNAERIEHIRMIRDVQDRTGGFRAFIPYTYQAEQPPEGPDAGDRLRVPADDRHRPALPRQRGPYPGFLADRRQGGRPAGPALRGGRPRLGDAGGERGLLGRRPPPLQPDGAAPPHPRGRPGPRAARDDVRAPGGARRPGERPGRRPRRLASVPRRRSRVARPTPS
ncbi:Cyclic dehypoxanthine futalosine synthase [Streptomyces antimycoticus]